MSNPTISHHREELEDQLQLQNLQRMRLAAMVIAAPKSRVGQRLAERFEELYGRLGEKSDPAMQRELTAQRQERNAELERQFQAADSVGLGVAPGVVREGLGTVLSTGPGLQDRTIAEQGPPSIANASIPTPRLDQVAGRTFTPGPSWVWLLSQLLKTDMKRLGLEPDELDDIRVFLIKTSATEYPKMKLLSHLPESLSPEALTKVFEDIRTMAVGYVVFVMVGRNQQEFEGDEDVKQSLELPRSVVSPFYGISTVEFDPEDILRKLE